MPLIFLDIRRYVRHLCRYKVQVMLYFPHCILLGGVLQAFYFCCNNYHRFSVIKNHRFIIVQFSSSEVQNESELGSNQDVKPAAFLLETLQENVFPCFFSFWRLPVLANGSFFHFQSSNFGPCSFHAAILLLPPSLLRTVVIILGPLE